MLFRLLLTVAGAALIGAAIVAIAYTVYCKITKGNLPEIIRDALRSSEEQKAKEMLAKVLQAKVGSIEGNTISISLLEEESESVQITITGTEIDSNIYEGMTLTA